MRGGDFGFLPTGIREEVQQNTGGMGTVRVTGVDMSDNRAMCFWADGGFFAYGGNHVLSIASCKQVK